MAFRWNALPVGVIDEFARLGGLRVTFAAQDLEAKYGPIPTDEAVNDLWPVIRDRWLAARPAPRLEVVDALRAAGVGNTSISVGSKAGQIEYLRSCRLSPALRSAVIAALMKHGDPDVEGTQASRDAAARGSAKEYEAVEKDNHALVLSVLQGLDLRQAGNLELYLFAQFAEILAGAKDSDPGPVELARQIQHGTLVAIASSTVDVEGWGIPEAAHRQQVVDGAHAFTSSEQVRQLGLGVYFVIKDNHQMMSEDPIAFLWGAIGGVLGSIAGANDVGPFIEGLSWLSDQYDDATSDAGETPELSGSGITTSQITPPDSDDTSPTHLHAWTLQSLSEILGTTPHVDNDNDFVLTYGSAVVYVRVSNDTTPSMISAFSNLVRGVESSNELLETLNEINAGLAIGSIYHRNNQVTLWATMPADRPTSAELFCLTSSVAEVADRLDTLLVKQFGGTMALEDRAEIISV